MTGATILYLHGFASGPDSAKGRALAPRFAERGIPFVRADLTPGERGFERSTPVTMLEEAERLVAIHRPRVLMGSSLGGYLATLVAARVPSIERLVLLAPAFRLFERWRDRLTAEEERQWRSEGLPVFHMATQQDRRLGWDFMEDASKLPAYPEVKLPTLCLTGVRDEVVPLEDVERFVSRTPTALLVPLDDVHELHASVERIFDETIAFLEPLLRPGTV